MPYRYHTLNTGTVTTGSTVTVDFKAEIEYTLKSIKVTERAAASINNTQVACDIDGVPVTRPDSPAKIFDPALATLEVIDMALPKGSTITFKVTNNEGADRNYDITLVLTYTK